MAILQTDVDAACEALKGEGQRPTVELVRLALKASPNSVTSYVRAWKRANEDRIAGAATVAHEPVELASLPPAAQRVIESVQKAIDTLPMALFSVIADTAEAERARSRLELQSAATGYQAQIDAARADAADERSAADSNAARADELEIRVTELESDVAARTAVETDLVSERVRLQALYEGVCTAKDEAEAEIGELTAQVQAFGQAVQAAQREAAASQAAMVKSDEEAGRLRGQADALQAKLEAAVATASEAKAELTVIQAALKQSEETAAALRNQKTELEAKLDAATSVAHEAEKALAVARASTDSEKARADRADNDVERLRKERADTEILAREAIERAARAEAENVTRREELARMEAEIAALRAAAQVVPTPATPNAS